MRFRLTKQSTNRKIGPIPVATASSDTCPESCALRGNGCYAEHGPLSLIWRQTDERGMSFADFLKAVRALPRRQLWRYGQAGDLPAESKDVLALADANGRRPVLCYTHRRDFPTYAEAAKRGFIINLSANSLTEADALIQQSGLPVVSILPSQFHRREGETMAAYRARLGGKLSLKTPGGRPVAICPATYSVATCSTCQACTKPRVGETVIGFPAHGSRRGRLDMLLASSGNENVKSEYRGSAIDDRRHGPGDRGSC